MSNSLLVERFISNFDVLFSTGEWVLSPRVLSECLKYSENLSIYVQRHVGGDWGQISDKDKKLNEEALALNSGVLFSAYLHCMRDGSSRTVWLMTNRLRTCTVMMFPDECFSLIDKNGSYSFVNDNDVNI